MRPAIQAVEAEVKRLEAMALPDLRAFWVERFGAPHPRHRSPDLLRRLMAWRIQEAVAGGLDRTTRKAVLGTGRLRPLGPILSPGVRLTREWKGRRCDVDVIDGGFLYEDTRYDSLSEVARKITGTRWNGPRFFGQRDSAGAKAA